MMGHLISDWICSLKEVFDTIMVSLCEKEKLSFQNPFCGRREVSEVTGETGLTERVEIVKNMRKFIKLC